MLHIGVGINLVAWGHVGMGVGVSTSPIGESLGVGLENIGGIVGEGFGGGVGWIAHLASVQVGGGSFGGGVGGGLFDGGETHPADIQVGGGSFIGGGLQ